ncbi:hypothetical protein, partial [Treponema sp.]|uniref:hypothetical protein n=1 Tax=Treponema sp. TaxID=166 RepID=UPI00389054FC
MKKITVPVLNILLAAGVLLILIGLLLFSHLNSDFSSEVPVFSIIIMIFGAVFFYVAMTVIHWAVIFFFGLLVFFL